MRIFQVFGSSTNLSIKDNITWYRNLYEPLIELGHDVVLIKLEDIENSRHLVKKSRMEYYSEEIEANFLNAHSVKPFDLFFSYLMDGMIEPCVIDNIRKKGVITCNFSCNNVHQFYLVNELSPHFDYNLHAAKNVGNKFLKIGANPLWWPMASNPNYFKPVKVPRNIPVSFVGANYARRSIYIHHLLESGIDAQVYGPWWSEESKSKWRIYAARTILLLNAISSTKPQQKLRSSAKLADFDFKHNLAKSFTRNMNLPVSDDELIALYSRSHISLGFLEVYDDHDPSKKVKKHVHLREFEAPMSGALYCTGYSDELAEMFEPDKEMIMYSNRDELLDKVNFYLKNPLLAEKIRISGRKRALAEHTYQQRFKDLFKLIELK